MSFLKSARVVSQLLKNPTTTLDLTRKPCVSSFISQGVVKHLHTDKSLFVDSLNGEEQDTRINREKTINSVTLLGRIGSNPQKRGSFEHPVVIFSLATSINLNSENGDVKTDWHRICIFKPNLRESAYNYATKGQRIMVQGKILYGEIKDSNGATQNTCSIVAEDIIYFK